MTKCINCGKEISDTAKVCNYCGTRVLTEKADTKICPSCGKEVNSTAKVCRFCGTKFEIVDQISVDKHYITWNIIPGQVAQKITEQEISSYWDIRGLIIQTGVKALFFINGKVTATLEAGKYSFKKLGVTEIEKNEVNKSEKKGVIARFLENVSEFIKGNNTEIKNKRSNCNVTIVLIRDVEFPLVFEFNDISTANIRSNVALHIVAKITNINTFYEKHLLDKGFVSYSSLADALSLEVKNILNSVLTSIEPQKIEGSTELVKQIFDSLKDTFVNVYPYIELVRILNLSCSQEALDNIRHLKEELYVAEQELEQTQLRNTFLNKLQNVDYAQQLSEARSKTDFEALMDKIDEDHLLNEEKKEQFALMLQTERTIREAKSESEIDVAIAELTKTGLLKEEEVDSIRDEIQHRKEMKQAQDDFDLSLAVLRNDKLLDKEQLAWEMEIGNKRIQNELERRRMEDEYDDARRRAEIELDKEEQLSQLEMLRQAQAIRNEREDAEHKREMEREKMHIDADMDRQKLYSTMTFEQIMASNPNITAEAAQALAKKFEADAMAAQADKTAEIAMKQKDDMQRFMEQQMELMRSMTGGKQSEMEHNQDRYMAGVQTAISSVAGALKPELNVPNITIVDKICPKCKAKNPQDSMFCSECGESL